MSKKKAAKSSKTPAQSNPPLPAIPPSGPRSTEKMMHDLHQLLNQQEFSSIEDMNAFLQDLLTSSGGFVPEMSPSSPLEEAQDLMYKAMESSNRTKRIKLARQALEISPDCADAYVLLAEENTRTPAEAKALYEEGVKAGERAIGKDNFEEMVGDFWAILETRPYMRARFGLAQCLWALGEAQQAIAHMRDLLRLNPGDNQGVRYLLLDILFFVGDDDGVTTLLKQYPDDWSANWKYTTALSTFRQKGKTSKANSLLREAVQQNRFVPPFVLGTKKLPRQLPPYISPGQENEAIDYAIEGIVMWQQTPGACDWLKEILAQKHP